MNFFEAAFPSNSLHKTKSFFNLTNNSTTLSDEVDISDPPGR
jgi:hypothetical protein